MVATPPSDPGFGDLVVCVDPSLDAAFHLGGKVGIVAERRKRDAQVLFTSPDRSVWLPLRSVRAASAEEKAASELAAASDLARTLSATTLEISAPEAGRLRLVMRHGALTPDRIDQLREEMGASLVAWKIRPGSMSRLESLFEIDPGRR